MIRFWRNPEFIRHVRAQMRSGRALTAAMITLVLCGLVALVLSTSRAQGHFFSAYYFTLVGLQFATLAFGCSSACGQAISRERELRTFDSWRSTRLTPAELLVGTLLGRPIMAYFVVGCSLPLSVLAGLWAGYSVGVIVQTYILMTAFALFAGLMGSWVSMLYEKASSGTPALLFVSLVAIVSLFGASPFPGLAALSLYPAMISLYAASSSPAHLISLPLFGVPSSPIFVALVLYGGFGAWLVVMLARNLKRNVAEIRLLSPWQAVAFAAFLNVMFYALLDSKKISSDVASMAVILNLFVLYMVGGFALTPRERLMIWWRERAAGNASFLSEDGPPWPWLAVMAGIAYGLMVTATLLLSGPSSLRSLSLADVAVQLLVFLAFSTRDILFLQWCTVTNMKRGIVGGGLFLGLYYFAASIFVAVAFKTSSHSGTWMVSLLTPFGVFSFHETGASAAPELYVGMFIQLLVINLLLKAISFRLERPATSLAPSAL